jgi:hypothetical protein
MSGQAHPFATIQGTTNTPRPAAPTQPQCEQAYTTTVKIHDKKVAADIYNCTMELPITVTQHELLLLSPELCMQVTDATIKQRVPHNMAQVLIKEINEREEENTTQLSHMPATFTTTANPQYQKAITMEPHEQHLKTVQTTQDLQEEVEVAAESNILCMNLLVINRQDQVKASLDPGCQVVAMSEEVCNVLAIAYNPDVRLSMVSANGSVNQLLGLAPNVSFLISDIMLCLQVHILHSPAYDILLGHPFNILTQSVICNFHDKNQTITIKDPNSGKSATISTVAHSSHHFAKHCAHTQ